MVQVSRVADAEETFANISEHVSGLMISSTQQSSASSLWQRRAAMSKPDIHVPDSARKPGLPTCPAVSLYGNYISTFCLVSLPVVMHLSGTKKNAETENKHIFLKQKINRFSSSVYLSVCVCVFYGPCCLN